MDERERVCVDPGNIGGNKGGGEEMEAGMIEGEFESKQKRERRR